MSTSSRKCYCRLTHPVLFSRKQWIVNVVYAIVGPAFAAWLKALVEERNAGIAAKRDMLVNMDPVIAQKLNASNHVSISKGKSAHLLKGRKQATPR